jgi:hypothetical protein
LQNNFLVVPRRGKGERKGGRKRRKKKERAFEDAQPVRTETAVAAPNARSYASTNRAD